mmetsp:Transcript_24237/g.67127  ORF Transcript_24237/g.67127 Transcript_24237/m.67127 type:complete len:276 (+) Transcript_24237:340-1167(+)
MAGNSCWKEPTSKSAFILSWWSTALTVVFASAGIGLYLTTGSAMCLVFGLENCVDFLSSVVVLWRFWATGTMTKEKEKTLKRRELRASMAISIILMILGLGVIATSSFDIVSGPETEKEMDFVLVMAGISILVFGVLCIFKFHYADVLSSESLYKDGVCSLIGTMLASALLANTLIIEKRPDVWWLDPCVAMICGFSALFIGIHSLVVAYKHRRVPIFSLSWWLMSRGSASTSSNRDGENSDEEADEDKPDDSIIDLEMTETVDGKATNLSDGVV